MTNSFEELQRRIIRFISSHSHASEEKIRELMMRPDELTTDVGSIVDGEEAVRIGLIDEVGGLDAALSALKGMIGEK